MNFLYIICMYLGVCKCLMHNKVWNAYFRPIDDLVYPGKPEEQMIGSQLKIPSADTLSHSQSFSKFIVETRPLIEESFSNFWQSCCFLWYNSQLVTWQITGRIMSSTSSLVMQSDQPLRRPKIELEPHSRIAANIFHNGSCSSVNSVSTQFHHHPSVRSISIQLSH